MAEESSWEDERRREAEEDLAEAERSETMVGVLLYKAAELRARANEILAQLPAWADQERKRPAWNLLEQARERDRQASRSLAFAEMAYTRAQGRSRDFPRARKALAAYYLRQFQAAERLCDDDRMAKYQELARAFDDGELAHQLSDDGTLGVASTSPDAAITVSRYEDAGGVLAPSEVHGLALPDGATVPLRAGSYLVSVRTPHLEVRYPLVVSRATRHEAHIHVPMQGEIPDGMVFIPGGPFLARVDSTEGVPFRREHLPDFAVGRFPVTLREYCAFLDVLGELERQRRTPVLILSDGTSVPLVVRDSTAKWRVDPRTVDGPARARYPRDRDLDLPVFGVTWFDALAYTRWISNLTGKAYRLPTDLEWEKACRGADGRLFPMGNMLDASFSKRRESRPEPYRPEPVGAFPLDVSPYGVRDLAGGIGDFTSSSGDGDPLPDPSAEHELATRERQVLYRGGSWVSTATMVNAMRFAVPLLHRQLNVGFRLAMSLEGSDSSYLLTEPSRP